MSGLIDLLQTFGILLVGLIARALLAVLVIAIAALPIAGVLVLVRMTRNARDRARGLLTTGHVRWQQGLYYAPGHLWLKPETDGALLVGMDDLAQRLLPAIDSVSVPEEGMALHKGDALGTLRMGERAITLKSPIDGKVVAVNPRVEADPSTVHRDPYRRGWLVSMKPATIDYQAFSTGTKAEKWFQEEDRRLTVFLEDRLGLAAADGGELTMPPHALLSDAAWQEMERQFFSGA
jgi:glycine cleavage system H protein